MAFDLSSPLAGLAWDMASRAKAAEEKQKQQDEYERNLINKRLTPYGGDISEYETEWQRGYGPQSAANLAQAQAMRNYWTGLPEIMLAAAKEGTAQASAGTSSAVLPQAPQLTPAQIREALGIPSIPAGAGNITGPSADALEGQSPLRRAAEQQRRRTAMSRVTARPAR